MVQHTLVAVEKGVEAPSETALMEALMLSLFELTDEATGALKAVSSGTFADPVIQAVPPGGTKIIRLYVRNTDPAKYYDRIAIRPVAAGGADIVDGSISIQLLTGNRRPSADDWAGAPVNSNSIVGTEQIAANRRLPTLGDSNGPDQKLYSLWVRIFMPLPGLDGSFNFEFDYDEGII